MVELPKSVLPIFVAAGWMPSRRVAVRCDRLQHLQSFPLAVELLTALGGLSVGTSGPGRDCARCDIQFTDCPSLDDRSDISEVESPGDDLFPLGLALHEHLELFLDAKGRLQAYGIPNGDLLVIGESFGEGIERLLLGLKWPEQGTSNG